VFSTEWPGCGRVVKWLTLVVRGCVPTHVLALAAARAPRPEDCPHGAQGALHVGVAQPAAALAKKKGGEGSK